MDGRTPRSFDNQDDSLLTEVTLLGDHQIRFFVCIYVIGSFLKNRIIATKTIGEYTVSGVSR